MLLPEKRIYPYFRISIFAYSILLLFSDGIMEKVGILKSIAAVKNEISLACYNNRSISIGLMISIFDIPLIPSTLNCG